MPAGPIWRKAPNNSWAVWKWSTMMPVLRALPIKTMILRIRALTIGRTLRWILRKRGDASNGYGVGWINAGEWLNYTVQSNEVKESGTYDIKIPVAAQKVGGLFHLEIEGKDLTGPIRIPDTGAWTQLKTVIHKGVKLTKGSHVIKVVMDKNGESGYVGDIDCMVFSLSE